MTQHKIFYLFALVFFSLQKSKWNKKKKFFLFTKVPIAGQDTIKKLIYGRNPIMRILYCSINMCASA